MYTIRKFAQLTGVTVKALRHYERLGLLTPKRTSTRYRQYSIADATRLNRLLALKSLGLPLKIVKKVLDGDAVDFTAHRHILEARRDCLTAAVERLGQIAEDPHDPNVLNRFIAEMVWERAEAARQRHGTTVPRAPDRASESRRTLFRQIEAALTDDPTGVGTHSLVMQFVEETGPETLAALKKRATWPVGMRRYIASLFGATPEAWDRVIMSVMNTPHVLANEGPSQ